MPASLVAIQIDGAVDERAHVETLLTACNEVADAGSCVDRYASHGEGSAIVVVVRWSSGLTSARIEARWPEGDSATRVLSFDEADDPRERWRSVGLTIGILAEAAHPRPDDNRESKDGPDPEAPPQRQASAAGGEDPGERETEDAVEAPWQRSNWWLDVMGITGPAFEGGPWHLGARARGWYRPSAAPVLGALGVMAGRRLPASDDVTLDLAAITATAGLAFAPTADFELRLRAGAAAALVAARRTPADGGPTVAGSALDVGWVAGLDASYAVVSWCSVLVGAETLGTTRDTVVRIDDDAVGRVPAFAPSLSAGVRLTAPEH